MLRLASLAEFFPSSADFCALPCMFVLTSCVALRALVLRSPGLCVASSAAFWACFSAWARASATKSLGGVGASAGLDWA